MSLFMCNSTVEKVSEARKQRDKTPRKSCLLGTLEVNQIDESHTLLDVEARNLIISYLGVIRASTDAAQILKRGRTSAKNIYLRLFLLLRCIGEAAPTVHALFPSFCGASMSAGGYSYGRENITLPPSIFFGLAFPSCDFLVLFACFEPFISEVHLYGSETKHSVEDDYVVIAIDAPSSPQFLFN